LEISEDILVVKYGSSCVATQDGLDVDRIDEHVDRLMSVSERYRLVVVSSGSIAVGRAQWKQLFGGDRRVPPKQNLATIGSARATVAWQNAFSARGLASGQIAVTHRELDETSEGAMFRKTMQTNISHGIISIVNENDALSDEEIKMMSYGGDNDGLASQIAQKLGAGRLCLLTSGTEGLLDEGNQLIDIVQPRNNKFALDAARDETDSLGSGGMQTKVVAAIAAAACGTKVHIANADRDIQGILDRGYGTYFPPHR
jgi:glutamate 5-kinase